LPACCASAATGAGRTPASEFIRNRRRSMPATRSLGPPAPAATAGS
jgi:hypothetical protein